MPVKPKKACNVPGCGQLDCQTHRRNPEHDKLRGSARERGYTTRWEKARKLYLKAHPLCEHCLEEGRIVASTVVDHKIPHRGDPVLFWDQSNWQALCETSHNSWKQKQEKEK